MKEFLMPLLGGLILGGASSLLLLLNGRILGVSGVLGGAIMGGGEKDWRWGFLGGILLAGGVMALLMPHVFANNLGRSLAASLVGGVLVGVGTQLGSGCTSGHGICGIGRGSPRSIAATMTFIAAGALAVVLIRHLLGGNV